MKRAEKKGHLVDVAIEMFNRYGYHAVGVDSIIAEAGVAKTTLYRHFETKELLIAAALQKMDEQFRVDLRTFSADASTDPLGQLFASFDFLESWFSAATFYGCPFIKAAGEYNDTNQIFQEVILHKRLIIAYFEELIRAAGLANPEQLAEEINLLHEGAIALAQVTRDASVAQKAKAVARKILIP
ncbi:MAG: TetR/AcrR family transcriptional regulator [Pseudomonadales bacterium]|nr:TetR/AcrR family transcriptional regulator [Pseudomonadales bacterium]